MRGVGGISGGKKLPLDQIVNGDCVEIMSRIADGAVNCVFADPPYNLQLKGQLRRPDETLVDGVTEAWDQFDDLQAYDRFTREWLKEVRRVLHPDGTIWVIGSYHNIFRVGAILQELGFWILNDVIWHKANPMPNFRGKRFTNAHETLIWAAKDQKSRYRFNYQAMKSLNEDVQMRSDWHLPICSGHERLRDETGKKVHPTQKPESLLYRVLLASTDVEDVVLDPFSGTGTTAAMAKRLGRRFIGIERDPVYLRASRRRVREEVPVAPEGLQLTPAKRAQPRIPFGNFVESGVLPAGTRLYDRQRRLSAVVSSDGSVAAGGTRASIHRLGALLTNSPSCNGWTFWHFERSDGLYPLDILRQEHLQTTA